MSRSAVEHAIDATIRLFSRRDRPTALFTVDSLMTQGALLGLRSMGLHIPHDVSLIGFDDFNLATFTDPQITVVAQPISEIGPLAGAPPRRPPERQWRGPAPDPFPHPADRARLGGAATPALTSPSCWNFPRMVLATQGDLCANPYVRSISHQIS